MANGIIKKISRLLANGMVIRKYIQHPLLWSFLVFSLLLTLYIHTLMPGTVGGDAGELQYAGPILALTHPTGLPLYIFVGHIWSKVVAVGTVAYRMNLLAAVSGALACAIMVWATYRITRRLPIAVAAGLVLGISGTFWDQAVLADKYAFNTLWVSLVVGMALVWAHERDQPHGNRLLYTLSFLYGISLLHHRTMLLLAFGLGFMVLYHERAAVWKNRQRTMICLALVLLPPLLVYPIFLPWIQARELAPSEWQPQSVGQWIEWLLDRGEAKEAFVTTGIWPHVERYLATIYHDYTLIVVAIALIGIIVMARRDPGSAFLLGFTFLLEGGLAANWRDNDRPFTYYLPSFILLVYAYAYGLHVLWTFIKQRIEHPRWRPASGMSLAALATIALVLQFNYSYPIRHEKAYYGEPLGLWRTTIKSGNMGERLASGFDDLPPNAVMLTEWEPATILWYYQQVEEVRPDITIKYPVANYFDEYEQTGRELCVSHHIVIGEEWHPTAYDALICLQREPTIITNPDELPARVTRLGTRLVNDQQQPQLELMGYWIDGTEHEAGIYVPLVLSWRALTDLEHNYSLSLRILRDWEFYSQQDIQHPVSGMYPTSRWVENELVHDYHELDLPPDMEPGTYFWGVEVYRPTESGGFEKLHKQPENPDAPREEFIFGGVFQVK